MFQRVLLISVMSLAMSAVLAQERNIAQDTLAFRQYLSDNIGTELSLNLIMRIYSTLADTSLQARDYYDYPGFGDYGANYLLVGRDPEHTYYADADAAYFSVPPPTFIDNPKFPLEFKEELKECARRYQRKDRSAERTRLVENLLKFDSLANNKPIFFATIHSRYGGNIRKYVDDLYGKSIMGSKSRLFRFCRWPTARKLQADLSVQFAIGLALYELWIKQVRDGKIPQE